MKNENKKGKRGGKKDENGERKGYKCERGGITQTPLPRDTLTEYPRITHCYNKSFAEEELLHIF